MAYCEECGDFFRREPSEHWKTLCLDCWKESKRHEVEELREENEELKEANEYLRLRLRQLEDRPANNYQQHLSDYLRVYPLLVKLAHPDRHGGSHEAHEVLVWCNRLRDDLKNGEAGATNTGSCRTLKGN
jgi:hypothetical protein